MKPALSFLFGLNGRIDRRTYLAVGLVLLLVKGLLDAALVSWIAGVEFAPTKHGWIGLSGQFLKSEHGNQQLLFIALAVAAVPFIWIGVAMTMRRALDAGLPPALGLLFFVPFVNFLVMLAFCVVPSRTAQATEPPQATSPPASSHAMFAGALCGVSVLVAATGLSVFAIEAYGSALFVGAPFVSGFITAWVLGQRDPSVRLPAALALSMLSLLAGGFALLILAWEGVLCLAMAFIPATLLSLLGAWMGFHVSMRRLRTAPLVMLMAWPLLTAVEAHHSQPEVRELLSVIEVHAPIDRVWQHVIAFKDIDAEPEWYFRSGIAYPLRARIKGSGVGAIRTCEFSTGPFIEPITTWDAPHHLAFGVTQQPPTMTELSPYRHVVAPHLEGNLRSHRGEFRLMQQPNGVTRIEARTWYSIDMGPAVYWQLWSDAIIHAIHMRVLTHIASEAERWGEAER